MLATGIRTDVGIKIYGASLDTINFQKKKKKAIEGTEGVKDLFAEPITGANILTLLRSEMLLKVWAYC
jgi:Cu(I)/Ag(I) efflux system membrane protein CusA/SilA